jgi:hypothetical protein
MAAEDKTILEIALRGDASEGKFFDELSRELASGTISRRRALKLAGAAILGSTGLLSLFPGAAGAQNTLDQMGLTAAAVGQGGCAEGEPAINNRECRPNPCGGNRNCLCAETVSGNKRCVNLRATIACSGTSDCDSNRDCSGDKICIKFGGCCGGRRFNICARPCN